MGDKTLTAEGLRSVVPVRTCQCCGKTFYRRKHESWTLYERRMYCDNTCRMTMLHTRNQAVEARKKASEIRRQAHEKEPVRYCEHCGMQMHRRINGETKNETISKFLKRRFCSIECRMAALKESNSNRSKKDVKHNIPDGYRPCVSIPGLSCSRNGEFWFRGKKKSVMRCKKRFGKYPSCRVVCEIDKVRYIELASRMVAEAWLPDYDGSKYIKYIDGDCSNYHASNLLLVTRKDYYKAQVAVMNETRTYPTYEEQRKIIASAKKELSIVEDYFNTGSFNLLHKYVNDEFYASLCDYCVRNLKMGVMNTESEVPNVIAHTYDVLMQGHAITNLTMFCRARLEKFNRTGGYGYLMYIPKKIELLINENLNLDALWEKYKVTKLK